MLSVDESRQVIFSHAAQLDSVALPLECATGRILRQEARADLDSPPFDASAMDGYALRRADRAAPRLRNEPPATAGGSRRFTRHEPRGDYCPAPLHAPGSACGMVLRYS